MRERCVTQRFTVSESTMTRSDRSIDEEAMESARPARRAAVLKENRDGRLILLLAPPPPPASNGN